MPPSLTFIVIIYHVLSFVFHQTLGQYEHITLIYDSADFQYPKESIQIWSQIIADNLESQCQISISINVIHVAPETDFNKELVQPHYGDNISNPFILITQCETAEAVVSHLWTLLEKPNIIFLDFFICQRFHVPAAFHLETFRFKSEIRLACVQFVTQKWMEKTVCSLRMDQHTKNLFNFTYSTQMSVEQCNQYHNPNPISDIYLSNLQSERNYVRHFLNGKPLRVIALNDPPWTKIKQSPENSSIVDYQGNTFDHFHLLQRSFNFTPTIFEPEDNVYGVETDNGTWDGMLGVLFRKEADILVHNYYVTPRRYKDFDFVLLGVEPLGILIPAADEDHRLFACTKPFGIDVWIPVLVLVVLLPFVIWIYTLNLTSTLHNSSATSLNRVYLFVYSVLVAQSNGPKAPNNKIAVVFLAATWSLAALLLTNVYKGKILSSLLIPKLNPIINSVEELPGSPLRWIVANGSALHGIAMAADKMDGIYGQLGEGLRQNPELIFDWQKTEIKLNSLVRTGTYAVISGLTLLEFVIEQDYLETKECGLTIAKEKFFKPGFVGMILKKDSPLTTIFDKKMLQVKQSGIDQYLRQKNRPKILAEDACENWNSRKDPKLKLHNLYGTFLILVFGLGFASAAFLFEILYHKIKTPDIRCTTRVTIL